MARSGRAGGVAFDVLAVLGREMGFVALLGGGMLVAMVGAVLYAAALTEVASLMRDGALFLVGLGP